MKLLVSNVGSTSLKFKLFEMPAERVLCDARIERVGGDDAIYTYKNCLTGHSERATGCHVPTYTEGIRLFLEDLCSENGAAQSVDEIAAVGFKTVLAKGFYGVHELTDEVKYLDYIERALLNGIMGSIEESGCKTYYQAMHPDAKRVFNPYDGGFWCCVGTGMENFPLAGGLICYEREKGLDLNLLVSCEVETRGGVRLRITAHTYSTAMAAK